MSVFTTRDVKDGFTEGRGGGSSVALVGLTLECLMTVCHAS